MQSSRLFTLSMALALVAIMTVQVDAQQGRPQGGRGQGGRGGAPGGGFGGPGGGGKLGLLRIDAVKKELELLDEQSADIEKLNEELRSQRSGDGPDFRNMSDEERRAAIEKFRADREALSEAEREKQDEERRAKQRELQQQADAKLADILLPHQMDRLSQIELQTQGIRALTTEEVAKELGLSDKVKADVEAEIQASGEKMRSEMQALFQGGNREGLREKMEELRKGIEGNVLAKLTQSQRDKFAEMKGEPFEMPQFGFGGPGGQRGGDGGGGQRTRGGDGGGRPQRPAQ
ncbi:MAG: hypothetical protein KDB05_09075 [Planctomycetales bacterium]|nr:hypothetical protein [Planctomycetales bacterium]